MHELRKGDTIQGISIRYGVSTAAIYKLNKLPAGSASALHLRTRLLIPPTPPPKKPEAARRHRRESDESVSEEIPLDEDESDVEEDAPLRLSRRNATGVAPRDGLYNTLMSMMR